MALALLKTGQGRELSQGVKGGRVMRPESTIKRQPRYLTVGQLAAQLQVCESTIYGWVERDFIPFLMAGDLLRFDPVAIDAWMAAEANRKREKKRTASLRVVK